MNRLTYTPRNGIVRSVRLSRRSLGVGGSLSARHPRGSDSFRLSQADYSALARLERQRALNLLLTILCFLVMAACVYLAQV